MPGVCVAPCLYIGHGLLNDVLIVREVVVHRARLPDVWVPGLSSAQLSAFSNRMTLAAF